MIAIFWVYIYGYQFDVRFFFTLKSLSLSFPLKLTDLWVTSLLFDLNYKFINWSFAFRPGQIYILSQMDVTSEMTRLDATRLIYSWWKKWPCGFIFSTFPLLQNCLNTIRLFFNYFFHYCLFCKKKMRRQIRGISQTQDWWLNRRNVRRAMNKMSH